MNRCLSCVAIFAVAGSLVLLSGCRDKYQGYIAVDSITKKGFVKNNQSIRQLIGREVKIWGYVDYGNIYADGANDVLSDWRAGNGPTPTTWRFNLKARLNDDVGESFAAYVNNDEERDRLLRTFIKGAETGKPTRVFVKGEIHTFDAPVNFSTRTGLRIDVKSTRSILLDYPGEQQ